MRLSTLHNAFIYPTKIKIKPSTTFIPPLIYLPPQEQLHLIQLLQLTVQLSIDVKMIIESSTEPNARMYTHYLLSPQVGCTLSLLSCTPGRFIPYGELSQLIKSTENVLGRNLWCGCSFVGSACGGRSFDTDSPSAKHSSESNLWC